MYEHASKSRKSAHKISLNTAAGLKAFAPRPLGTCAAGPLSLLCQEKCSNLVPLKYGIQQSVSIEWLIISDLFIFSTQLGLIATAGLTDDKYTTGQSNACPS